MAERYRLEALLRLKERNKKQAEVLLARAIGQLEKEKKKLETLKEEKKEIVVAQKEARKKMDAEMSAGGFVGKGCVHVNFLRKLKEQEAEKQEEVDDQVDVVEEATAAVAKAKRRYIDTSKEHQMMKKHKELWAKKVRQEMTRKEEHEMDELGQTIHGLRRWRGEKSVFEI